MKRTYTVPLRRSFCRTERHQRAKKATSTLRAFLAKHMKTDTVKIGHDLNVFLWSRGIRKPPGKVTVVCEKDEVGVVYADLEGRELQSEINRRLAAEKAAEEKAAKKAEKAAKKEAAKVEEKADTKKAAEEKEATADAKPAAKEEKPAKPAKKTAAKKTSSKKASAKKSAASEE